MIAGSLSEKLPNVSNIRQNNRINEIIFLIQPIYTYIHRACYPVKYLFQRISDRLPAVSFKPLTVYSEIKAEVAEVGGKIKAEAVGIKAEVKTEIDKIERDNKVTPW
jgi:hypothetical protein